MSVWLAQPFRREQLARMWRIVDRVGFVVLEGQEAVLFNLEVLAADIQAVYWAVSAISYIECDMALNRIDLLANGIISKLSNWQTNSD
jgi:hypothetical protein